MVDVGIFGQLFPAPISPVYYVSWNRLTNKRCAVAPAAPAGPHRRPGIKLQPLSLAAPLTLLAPLLVLSFSVRRRAGAAGGRGHLRRPGPRRHASTTSTAAGAGRGVSRRGRERSCVRWPSPRSPTAGGRVRGTDGDGGGGLLGVRCCPPGARPR